MKIGVKSLILLALFISNVALASWHSGAWPSTNHYRIASPANYLAVSNLWAKQITEVWSQESTTNYIPDRYLANMGVSSITDLGITNYSIAWNMPIYAYFWSNAPYSRSWTNIYNTIVVSDAPSNMVSSWTNSFYGTNQVTNVIASARNDWTILTDGNTNIYTTTVSGQEEGTNKTFRLDVQQIWEWDAYMSIAERERVLTTSTNKWNVREGEQPRIYLYRDSYGNLTNQKAWIKTKHINFVDMNQASNGTYDTYFATGYTSSWTWTEHEVSATDTNIVTNYIANVAYPSTFPAISELVVYDKYGMPYELDIRTNQFRVDVPGWFAGQTNVQTVSSYTWTAVWTNGGPTKTWFDYTPYRDFGGWGDGQSNIVDGVLRFEYDVGADYPSGEETWFFFWSMFLDMAIEDVGYEPEEIYRVPPIVIAHTNRWFVNDSCGTYYIAEELANYMPYTNTEYGGTFINWEVVKEGVTNIFNGHISAYEYKRISPITVTLYEFSSVVTNYDFIAETTTYATPLYSPNLQGPPVSATYSNTVEFDSYQRIQDGTNALRYIVFETVSTQRVDVLWPIGTYYETQSLLESSTNLVGYVTNSPAPVITNILFSQVFTNGTVYTQDFTCVNSEIAAGRCEADYGYKYLPDWINELQWTAKADPTYSTIGCDTNPAGEYWMGDGANNPTITTNTPPSSDLVRITNSVVAPKQWWETVMSTNYAYGDPVTNVITANGAVMFVPTSYWDCNTESWYYYGDDFAGVYYDTCDITLAEILSNTKAYGDYVTYISGCEAYLKEWGSAYFNAEYNEIYGIEPFELECVSTPVYTNIVYSLQSDYKLSDVAFNLLATIESEKVPYYRLSPVSGHQVLATNICIYTNAFATNVYVSATNYTYVTNTCCAGYASEYENIHVSGTNYTYSTNLYNPTNITYDIGSVMPSTYTNTIFKAWTASAETSTNSKFCDDLFTTDLLPEPTYNGTNYTAYGFELDDAKLLIKWQFTYGPTDSP